MKIFLSWSGPTSRLFAHKMLEFLSQVLPWSEIYLSDDEIESGERWLLNISDALEGSSYGIILITEENKTAPWVLFEAGALSKKIADSRVVPLLCDIEDIDLTGNPLSQFQYRKLNRGDVERLIKDISTKSDVKVAWDRLNKTFEKFWPDFEPQFKSLQADSTKGGSSEQTSGSARQKNVSRSEFDQLQDSLNEILRSVRSTQRSTVPRNALNLEKFDRKKSAQLRTDLLPVSLAGEDYFGEVDLDNGVGYLKSKVDESIVAAFHSSKKQHMDWVEIFSKGLEAARAS